MICEVCIIFLLGTIPYSLSAPDPLDTVNINLNLGDGTNRDPTTSFTTPTSRPTQTNIETNMHMNKLNKTPQKLGEANLGVIAGQYHPHAIKANGRKANDYAQFEEPFVSDNKEDVEYWMKEGRRELKDALDRRENRNIAKNIILFIGDGMSVATVTATRIYKNQKQGGKGYEEKLEWEKHLTNVALSKTYNADMMVTDSAASAFAIYSGVKTKYYTMGYDSSIEMGNASSMLTATPVDTVLQWAQDAGWQTGFVTTSRVSDATPAALYAKTAHRYWECDWKLYRGEDAADYVPNGVMDITRQLVEKDIGLNTNIILGGGLASFIGTNLKNESDFDCPRIDKRNLLNDWLHNTRNKGRKGTIVKNKSELQQLEKLAIDQVLGLFSWSHMPYHDEHNSSTDIPTLAEMTDTAIDFLQSKTIDKGFFLMVESGRIDLAHHDGQAVRALNEGIALDDAVAKALSKVSLEDTLVIVTADHAHTFTVGGYTGREADITGLVVDQFGKLDLAEDGLPFTILSYANGPGFNQLGTNQTVVDNGVFDWTSVSRNEGKPLSQDITGKFDFLQAASVPLDSETHGADDVGIWAGGPMAHLFHGVHQQSYIGHVMSLAGCIGPHRKYSRCNRWWILD